MSSGNVKWYQSDGSGIGGIVRKSPPLTKISARSPFPSPRRNWKLRPVPNVIGPTNGEKSPPLLLMKYWHPVSWPKYQDLPGLLLAPGVQIANGISCHIPVPVQPRAADRPSLK